MDDSLLSAARARVALTTGDLARLLTDCGYRTRACGPVPTWMIRRVYERGRVGESVGRLGTYRLIPPADVLRVVAALREFGYLRAGRV